MRRTSFAVVWALLSALIFAGGALALIGRVPGGDHDLALPAGSTDVVLSADGRWAWVATVTFNAEEAVPQRVVSLVDLDRRSVVWRRALPSPTCCAFPVLAATAAADAAAMGGAEQTVLFDRQGRVAGLAALGDGGLHTAAALTDDGRLLAVGESRGRVAVFVEGRRVWVKEMPSPLLALALSADGSVLAAVLRDRWILVRPRDGALLHSGGYGPARVAAAATSHDGRRVAIVWKRQDQVMDVMAIERGQRLWGKSLGPGTVPLLQVDRAGRWLAVGDLLGRQAAVYTFDGIPLWQMGGAVRSAAAVSPDGRRAAVAAGREVEVRTLPAGRTVWRGRLPGVPHLLRTAGPRLAALLSADPKAALPDRLWWTDIPR